ncbi:probable E3 ubiquitin-protein ligase RHB1A isoform X2 [Aristolochia californica]|uniref:probable E3 ubiquitin-protein ligase RHB1A isoform X2 n=1 Tax=Aristolochia californica TaxID=171875 RepID=UPI0035DF8DC5
MGGCCSSRRRAELNESPVYYYRQRNFEKRNSLPTTRGATFASSAALLVDANLETSIPDTYRPQPAPLPYDADLRPQHQAMIGRLENAMDKDAQSARETLSGCSLESLLASEDLKESDPKSKTACPPGTPKTLELEPSKENESIIPATNDEDVCPTCLEDYDEENPRILTKCEHHFHLACILEWRERSDTCPICDREMVIDQNFDR